MCPSSSPASRLARRCLLASVLWVAGTAQAARDLSFESAATVNEGPLHFLESPPARPPHHHQNHIRIDAESLATGWVGLAQCHDHLDAVPSAQITFREGFVRDLEVEVATHIEAAWVEGATVQLRNVEPGARLCLSAQTRALRDTGSGYYNLSSGPYMRKFLDGYYPMRVTLAIDYPAAQLKPLDISPPPQPGLDIVELPGSIRMEALFEGEFRSLVQFESTTLGKD